LGDGLRFALALLSALTLTGCQLQDLWAPSKPPPLSAGDKYALAKARLVLDENRDRVATALAKENAYHGIPTDGTIRGLIDAEGGLANEAGTLLNQFDTATGNHDDDLKNAINAWRNNSVDSVKAGLGRCEPGCLIDAPGIIQSQYQKLDKILAVADSRLSAPAYRTSQHVTLPATNVEASNTSASETATATIAGCPSLGQAPSGGGISIITMNDVVCAIGQAHTITATAFTLSTHTNFARALESAHARGAVVTLELDSEAFGGALSTNNATAAEFKAQGIGVIYSQGPLHAKVALIDHLLVLSDRNWDNEGGFIITDTNEDDRNVVAELLRGQGGSDGHFWTVKGDGLAAEAKVIAADKGSNLAYESESFGDENPVYDALMAQARAGKNVRVIVAAQEYDSTPEERDALAALKTAGVHVKIGTTNEKLVVTPGELWFGSTNSTKGYSDQIDWSMITSDPNLQASIARRFEENWAAAQSV
jgi:hypothetical protein